MAFGIWLHLTEWHQHEQVHEALEHEHKRTHAPLAHSHAHFPDAHHRHDHS